MRRMLRRIGFVLMIFSLIVFPVAWPGDVAAQDAIQITDEAVDSNFREYLTFTVEAESSAEITDVILFYRVVGQLATSKNEVDFTPGTTVSAEFTIDQTEPANYLPPGTELNYWWKIIDAEGNELTTEKSPLLYLDNRYDWNTLENERLALYWYEGNDSFGQELFDRANLALDTLETDVGIALENPIKIFIYANHRDLLEAISTSAQEWTGGQAFTRFGVVVIGVAPSQLEWGLNAMTHEMTHLVIHQATENPFGDLPRWLDEGIAVYNENRDELDDDFKPIFDRAVEQDELMTLRTLSSPFPSDPLQANLAYGQSGAVVKFIIDTYGSDAMAELLEIFSEGALYDEALEQALGVDTDQLDNAFRADLGLSSLPGTESSAAEAEAPQEVEPVEPEAAAEAMTEAEEGTESSEAPAEEEASTVTESEAEPAAAAESVEAEAVPQAEAEPESQRSPLGLSCLTGLVPLIGVGLAFFVRSRSPRRDVN